MQFEKLRRDSMHSQIKNKKHALPRARSLKIRLYREAELLPLGWVGGWVGVRKGGYRSECG